MKKTSFIALAIVSSLAFTLCSAQDNNPNQIIDTNNEPHHTQRTYNYVYRSRFRDGLFKFFSPRKYQALITSPGFRPRTLRPEDDTTLRKYDTTYYVHGVRIYRFYYYRYRNQYGQPIPIRTGGRSRRGGFGDTGHNGFPVVS